MENKKLTAVEWFEQNISKYIHYQYDEAYEQHQLVTLIFEKAKQMEKEQIEKAWWAGHDERDANHMIYPSEDCNQYYNETYNK